MLNASCFFSIEGCLHVILKLPTNDAQLPTYDENLPHMVFMLSMIYLIGKFTSTHDARKLLLFSTKIASTRTKVALKKFIKTYTYEI